MTRIFLIRFAKGKTETPLYLTDYKGKCAFCPEIEKSYAWRTKKDAEEFLKVFLSNILESEIKSNLLRDLQVEEHVFGDYRQ